MGFGTSNGNWSNNGDLGINDGGLGSERGDLGVNDGGLGSERGIWG